MLLTTLQNNLQTTTSYSGVLKRWNGASWVKAKMLVYSGSFIAKPVKRWNGTAWVEIDVTGI